VQNQDLPTDYQKFIHISRYARWDDSLGRRETWKETVSRYFDFMEMHLMKKHDYILDSDLKKELTSAVLHLEIMPSMRALMTAGPALERDNIAGFNCAYLPINSVRSFDEILYVLMCFHPDTMVVTKDGNKRIADVHSGDQVASFDEESQKSVWRTVSNQVKTPSAHKPKVQIVLDNGHIVKCTADHQWLTTNRGWVEAGELTPGDDLVAPRWTVYHVTNLLNGKVYIGQTSKTIQARFKEHLSVAKTQPSEWHFAKALRKYDETAWQIKAIDFAFSSQEACEKESHWVSHYGTITTGYNSTLGGEGASGYKWTKEQRQRASDTAYERTPEHRDAQRAVLSKSQDKILQTRQTDEYRLAQRERNLGAKNPQYGKHLSDERKAHMSSMNTGEKNPFYGQKHTEETKAKMKNYWVKRHAQTGESA